MPQFIVAYQLGFPILSKFGSSSFNIANLKQFNSQNGIRQLFGKSKDLWNVGDAQKFILALERMWKKWPKLA